MADNKKPQPPIVGPELAGQPFKQGPQVVGKIEQLSATGRTPSKPVLQSTPGTPIAGQFSDAQLARIEKAIIVGSVLSGMLAAGRIPASTDNIRTAVHSIQFGLEQL